MVSLASMVYHIRTTLSSIDYQFTKVSKVLNGKKALCLQTIIWSCVAYICILNCKFNDEHLLPILAVSYFPAIYLTGYIVCYFPPTMSSTIANFFGDHGHLYTCVTSFVEMSIVWLITLLKQQISAEDESWSSYLLIVSVYYTIVTVCELLRLKDRGSINGCASVIILVLDKRFGFGAVPITAAIVFGKNLLCSDCCESCRARKEITKEAEAEDRNKFLLSILNGETFHDSGAFGSKSIS